MCELKERLCRTRARYNESHLLKIDSGLDFGCRRGALEYHEPATAMDCC
jgi:hypothetical protein